MCIVDLLSCCLPHSPALVVCRVSEVWCRLRLVWAALGGLILLLLLFTSDKGGQKTQVRRMSGDQLELDQRGFL